MLNGIALVFGIVIPTGRVIRKVAFIRQPAIQILPMPILLLPVVTEESAEFPIATLKFPVVLAKSALPPEAVLELPSVLA